MVFCNKDTLDTLNLLENNPKDFLKILSDTFLENPNSYNREYLYNILRDYDNESYIFNGGNALHCLCMIIGNKHPKPINEENITNEENIIFKSVHKIKNMVI